MALLSMAFLLWGMLRSLDDVLVALFSASGMLNYTKAMLVHSSFFSAYLTFSIPSGIYLRRYGYRKALTQSLLLMGTGSAICTLAASIHSFTVCIGGIFVMALGITALQTAANPYIGLLGEEVSATARLLLAQACNSLGSIIGPLASIALFGSWSLYASGSPLIFPGRKLVVIYGVLTLFAGGLSFLLSRYFAEIPSTHGQGIDRLHWRLLRDKRLGMGVLAVFLYVGCEATLLAETIPYLSRQHPSSVFPSSGAVALSVYWAAMLAGRICAVRLLKWINTRSLLRIACVSALVLICGGAIGTGIKGALCLLLVGFCNAVIFPSIFTLSTSGLRKEDLPVASGLLSTAIVGGGVMPVLSGLLTGNTSLYAFIPPCMGYLLIVLCSTAFPGGHAGKENHSAVAA